MVLLAPREEDPWPAGALSNLRLGTLFKISPLPPLPSPVVF